MLDTSCKPTLGDCVVKQKRDTHELGGDGHESDGKQQQESAYHRMYGHIVIVFKTGGVVALALCGRPNRR